MNTTLDSDGVEEKIHGLDTQRLQLTFKAQQTQKKVAESTKTHI